MIVECIHDTIELGVRLRPSALDALPMSKLTIDQVDRAFPLASEKMCQDIVESDNVFSKYFPHIEGNPDVAAFELEWIWSKFSMNPLETVPRSLAKKQIRQFASFIRRIANFEVGYWKQLSFLFLEENSRESFRHSAMFEFILDVDEWKESGDLDSTISGFVVEAFKAIDATP